MKTSTKTLILVLGCILGIIFHVSVTNMEHSPWFEKPPQFSKNALLIKNNLIQNKTLDTDAKIAALNSLTNQEIHELLILLRLDALFENRLQDDSLDFEQEALLHYLWMNRYPEEALDNAILGTNKTLISSMLRKWMQTAPDAMLNYYRNRIHFFKSSRFSSLELGLIAQIRWDGVSEPFRKYFPIIHECFSIPPQSELFQILMSDDALKTIDLLPLLHFDTKDKVRFLHPYINTLKRVKDIQQFIQSLPENWKEAGILSSLCSSAQNNMNLFSELRNIYPDQIFPVSLLEIIPLKGLSQKDIEPLKHLSDEEKINYAPIIVKTWKLINPDSLKTWLKESPNTPAHDYLRMIYIKELYFNRISSEPMDQLISLKDKSSARFKHHFFTQMINWQKTDKASAQEWLNKAALPDDLKSEAQTLFTH